MGAATGSDTGPNEARGHGAGRSGNWISRSTSTSPCTMSSSALSFLKLEFPILDASLQDLYRSCISESQGESGSIRLCVAFKVSRSCEVRGGGGCSLPLRCRRRLLLCIVAHHPSQDLECLASPQGLTARAWAPVSFVVTPAYGWAGRLIISQATTLKAIPRLGLARNGSVGDMLGLAATGTAGAVARLTRIQAAWGIDQLIHSSHPDCVSSFGFVFPSTGRVKNTGHVPTAIGNTRQPGAAGGRGRTIKIDGLAAAGSSCRVTVRAGVGSLIPRAGPG